MTISKRVWAPNEAQSRAVAHGTGPLRIQAGAGSGKTTTLIQRIRSLVERGFCTADQILMLTFTTKAVADMREKVAAELGPSAAPPRIETYHAYAWSLVQEFGERLGLPPEPTLLSEGPLRLLVRQQIDRLGLDAFDLTRIDTVVGKLLSFAGWYRHEGAFRRERSALLEQLTPDDDLTLVTSLLGGFDAYRQLLREKGAADYDDVIALAVDLLEQHEDVRAEVCARHPFLLVDEYQDTDHLQGILIRLLCGDTANVTIVGDPDQTIYSFRGAAMTNILDFHTAYDGVTDVAMVTNYRSTPAIVAAANAVIGQNQRRKAESLAANRPDGPRPLLVTAPDWESEARWLATKVQALHAEGVPYAEMAVMVRKNRHKLPLYGALLAAGIPVQVVGGFDLFDDPETVRCIGYLRAVANPADDGALSIALSLPRYGLTDADLAALARGRASKEALSTSLLQAVRAQAEADPRLALFLAEFWPLYALQFQEGCQATVRGVIDLHGPGLGPQSRANAEQLIPLADALFARPDLFEGPAQSGGLVLFVAYLEALRGVGDSIEAAMIDTEQEAVKLMTVHSAKGLEFGTLFLPRLTERDFAPKATAKWDKPFPLVWHHDKEFAANVERMLSEEERRLFYVAVTRARDRLFLSWAPLDPRRVRPLAQSPFLAEVAGACDALDLEPVAPDAGPGLDLGAILTALVSTDPAHTPVAQTPTAQTPALPAVLSFSHLQTYQLCPYRFALQYLVRAPGRPTRAPDEGLRVHAAIEQLAKALTGGETVSTAPALPLASDPDQLRTEAEPEPEPGHQLTMIDPLQAYQESEYAQVPPLASEQEFHLRLGPAVVRGFIDRLHPLPDGGVEVVDFKTYNRLMTAAEVKEGLQLPLYILGTREALGFPEARSGALFFLKHAQVVRITYTEAELEAAQARACNLVDAIYAHKFDPTPGNACTFCPYRDTCPVSPTNGRGSFESRTEMGAE